MKLTITSFISQIAAQLQTEFCDPVLMQQTAWWLVEAITKIPKSRLIAQQEVELSPEQQKQLDAWIYQLTQLHKPLQYILGTVPFADLEIIVQPPILIPRPETEEWVLKLIHQLLPFRNEHLTILDIGTGTGCVALALAKALPNATVTALDMDPQALDLACTNAHHNRINNIGFLESDVFATVGAQDKYDLIVSNPPYITQEEWKVLDPSVTEWENPHALVAMHEGLAIIERIVAGAPQHLSSDSELHMQQMPRLIIEIGYKQGPVVQQLMKLNGFHHVDIQKDLEGKDRAVWGRF